MGMLGLVCMLALAMIHNRSLVNIDKFELQLYSIPCFFPLILPCMSEDIFIVKIGNL